MDLQILENMMQIFYDVNSIWLHVMHIFVYNDLYIWQNVLQSEHLWIVQMCRVMQRKKCNKHVL